MTLSDRETPTWFYSFEKKVDVYELPYLVLINGNLKKKKKISLLYYTGFYIIKIQSGL